MNIFSWREYPFVTTEFLPSVKHFREVLRLPAVLILTQVNAYSAILLIYSSEMEIAGAACGCWQQFNCLSPNCVSYCKAAQPIWARWRRRKGGGREEVRRMRQAAVGGVVGGRGRPKKTDATTVAVALLDINSPEPHCANLIGNVSAAMLCLHHMLASKWNEWGCEKNIDLVRGDFQSHRGEVKYSNTGFTAM